MTSDPYTRTFEHEGTEWTVRVRPLVPGEAGPWRPGNLIVPRTAGLVFRSAEGERRVLPMEPPELPTDDRLAQLSEEGLRRLLDQASPHDPSAGEYGE
jgi:hypothetical protein